jgi:hypothetical protein
VLYFPTPHIASETSGMAQATHALGNNIHPGSGYYIPSNRNVSSPSAVAVSPDGKLIFVADQGFSRILRFTLNEAPTLALLDEDNNPQPAHIQLEEGTSTTIRISAVDLEGDDINLEIIGLNAHMSFDSAPQTLIFDAAALSPGYRAYATVVATDSSPRANRAQMALSFEVIKQQTPTPTTQSSGAQREPEALPEGGCQSTPISALALVIPFLLIYRRRLTLSKG